MDTHKLEGTPIGLLPDSVIASAYGCSLDFVKKFRESRGIGRYSLLNNPRFPSKEKSFNKLIKEWGVEKSRQWLYDHARNLIPFFELDVTKASYAERNKIIDKSLRGIDTVTTFPFGSRASEEHPGEKEAERKKIQEEMDKFLANGGKKTICKSAGWAAKEPSTATVYTRSAVGMRAKAAL